MKTALPLLAAVLVSGCATGHLYPIQGPLSAQTPMRTYAIRIDSVAIVTVKLGSGELCRGMWSNLPKEDPTSGELSAEWDLVYGKGYYLAEVRSSTGIARAVLDCTSGMTVNVQFSSTKGIAKDSHGDVFKLTF
jgi:hypothetical protein